MTRNNRNGRASEAVPNPSGKDSAVNSNSARLKVTPRASKDNRESSEKASRASKVNRESRENASKGSPDSKENKRSRASKASRVRDKRRVETPLKGASSNADQDNKKAVRVVVL